MTNRKTASTINDHDLDQLYGERDEARQAAAAIAAQRDRLRQRMNTLADHWETALPGQPHHGFAQALRAEISVAPFDPNGAMTVHEYTERGRTLWAFRCWGTDTCDGWLGLGHHTQTSALLERERHVAEEHTEPTVEARLAHLQATSEAAGRLLARESDRASRADQRLLDMTLNRDQLQAALTRVRALHTPITYPHPDMPGTKAICLGCEDATSEHPCNTLAALDEPAPEPAATQPVGQQR